MSRKQNLYIGRSGQLAVMAEFLYRGYNAAIPEVDVGEDVFVVRDDNGELSRIQVKAAEGKGKRRITGTFNVPVAQLKRFHEPELYYVFVVRYDNAWRDFVPISRPELETLLRANGIGTEVNGSLIIRLSFREDDVLLGPVSLQSYRNNWSQWPPIKH